MRGPDEGGGAWDKDVMGSSWARPGTVLHSGSRSSPSSQAWRQTGYSGIQCAGIKILAGQDLLYPPLQEDFLVVQGGIT